MKAKHQYLIFIYWIALLADCFFIYFQQDEFRYFSKPALMILLLLFYLANSPNHYHLPSKLLVCVALSLALSGDIFLLFKGELFFILGLASFLIMHLIYIIYFWRMLPLFPIRDSLYFFLPILIVAVVDVLVMIRIVPLAGDLASPLIGYMVVISIMFVMAFNILSGKARSLAVNYFIPGSGLFILSDTLLGLNMFLFEDYILGIPVMLTYGFAQYLMVKGFVKHVKKGKTLAKAK